MATNQESYVLGYIFDYPDGTSKFVPVFEGTFIQTARINLDKMTEMTEFHGNRPITGARWEVRKASEVYPERKPYPVFQEIFENHFPGLKVS